MRRVRDVILLEEAAGDLGEGMAFYEAQQQGIGCYFFDSILADIDSLLLYAGVHSERLGAIRLGFGEKWKKDMANKTVTQRGQRSIIAKSPAYEALR